MIVCTDSFMLCPIYEDEIGQVLEVYRQCADFLALTPKSFVSLEIVREDLAQSRLNNGVFCGIYNTQGAMMGIVDVVLNGFEGEASSAFIELLIIGGPFRGNGLGSSVVRAVESEITQNVNITVIWIAVMVNNPGAIQFWQHHGYTKIGEPRDEPDGTTVWRFRKPIRLVHD